MPCTSVQSWTRSGFLRKQRKMYLFTAKCA
nr:MAG TPA: hypothetical protein [Caudoviricetes sp.]